MPTSALTIREATAADVDALYALIVAIAEHHGQLAFVHTTVATLRRDGFGPNPKFGAIVAESGGKLVGYVSYSWNYSIWLTSTYMHIDDVFVLESHRGQGIGEALMLKASQVCKSRGAHRIRWEVETDNATAIRFYERLGAKLRIKGIFGWDV